MLEHESRGVRLRRLLLVLGCVSVFGGVVAARSENTASALGVDAITRMLTAHEQWALYWDRGDVGRPRLGSTTTDRSPSATLEFMRVGSRVVGHAENDQVHHVECEFEVTVREDRFAFAGCLGPEKTMIYQPDDPEYPFKGRVDGTWLWLAPSR